MKCSYTNQYPTLYEAFGLEGLIQNAVHCFKCNEIITSKDEYDYVKCTCGNTMVDGGRISPRGSCGDNSERLYLYGTDTTRAAMERLAWGTYGKTGQDPLKYVLLKDCTSNHLQAIINMKKKTGAENSFVGHISKLILKSRENKSE
jgi:hypothetical protein